MNFQFTDEQLAIKQMAKDFADNEMAPYADQWDKEAFFPKDTLLKAAGLGLAGIYTRDDIGGSNLSRLDAALIFEELSSACIPTAAFLSIHNMSTWLVDTFGSEALRLQWGPKLVSMEAIASYCLTEPSSGSDAAALRTTAIRDGDHYVLNGSKCFISGGSISDVYLCMVRTGDSSHHGISCILVPKDTPGLSFGKKEKKLGWNSSPTTMVFFENCKVPVTHLVGTEGEGFKMALKALNGGRVNIAACSLGGAKACLRMAKHYLFEREQFKHKLADFQTIQFRFAELMTDFEAARLMVYRAAIGLDGAENSSSKVLTYCAMAKQYATDIGFNIANQVLQLFGGYGYLKDYPIERYFRDLRVHQILEGTNEIMRLVVAKQTLADDFVIE